jgi:hypothetical protein
MSIFSANSKLTQTKKAKTAQLTSMNMPFTAFMATLLKRNCVRANCAMRFCSTAQTVCNPDASPASVLKVDPREMVSDRRWEVRGDVRRVFKSVGISPGGRYSRSTSSASAQIQERTAQHWHSRVVQEQKGGRVVARQEWFDLLLVSRENFDKRFLK